MTRSKDSDPMTRPHDAPHDGRPSRFKDSDPMTEFGRAPALPLSELAPFART
jgi:hypothetical protein